MVRASSFCCCVSLSFLSPSLLAGVSAALPGPGIDVAFDANGDGISSYGDRYVFNYWLALGGNLAEAMASAQIGRNGTIDVSEFLHSSDALLAPASTVEYHDAENPLPRCCRLCLCLRGGALTRRGNPV